MNLPVDQILRQGIEAQKAGEIQDAERLYRSVLHEQPANPDANHLLGVLSHQMGEAEIAVRLITKAVQTNPAIAGWMKPWLVTKKPCGSIPVSLRRT
jgi:Flp pilus assembly protein TadD